MRAWAVLKCQSQSQEAPSAAEVTWRPAPACTKTDEGFQPSGKLRHGSRAPRTAPGRRRRPCAAVSLLRDGLAGELRAGGTHPVLRQV